MLGKDAMIVLVGLILLMSEKMDETIPYVHSWINGQIAIMAVRSYSHMIL